MVPCYPRLREVVRDWESYSPGHQATLCSIAKLVAGAGAWGRLGAELEDKLALFVRTPPAPIVPVAAQQQALARH